LFVNDKIVFSIVPRRKNRQANEFILVSRKEIEQKEFDSE